MVSPEPGGMDEGYDGCWGKIILGLTVERDDVMGVFEGNKNWGRGAKNL